MKTRFLVFAAALIVLGAGMPAAAGTDLSLFGAWFTPSDLDSSFGGGAKLDVPLGGSPLAIELRGSWFPELGRDLSDFIEDTGNRVIEVEMIPLDVGLNVHLFDARNLYLGGGVSYIMLDSNIARMDDEFGWYLAAGVKAGASAKGMAFFIEGMYRVVEGTVEDGEFNDFDVDVDGFGVNAGIALRF